MMSTASRRQRGTVPYGPDDGVGGTLMRLTADVVIYYK